MSDDKGPVRVGRFEWERLMLMSVEHPTNFKLLPIGVFMSVDGGRIRPGNGGLAQFGPHEKTWAKLLRWAVAEGWLLQIARGGARRGPNGTTIVRASVYAASVPLTVWERRMEILGAPPFRAAGVEGSAPDSLKGAPGDSPEGLKGAPEGSQDDADSLKGAPSAPFNAPDPSLKGAPGDSLPDSLKGASGVFEGSDPTLEGSDGSFEGSAQALPHHVVTSRSDSSSTSSTTPGAGDSPETDANGAGGTGGGGGGDDSSSQDQEQEERYGRAQSFVDSLDYRGQLLSNKTRLGLTFRVAAAFEAGWSDRGLLRYLDISDDPNVRTPAAVYMHRLKDDELPAATAADPQLPPACWTCLGISPTAATDLSIRVNPITGDPCPDCNPAAAGQAAELPPACETCLEENPASRTNPRVRYRIIDDVHQACPDCNPKRIAILAAQNSQRDGVDGDVWGRAEQRVQTGDWRGAGPDERVAGWAVVGNQLAAPARRSSAAVRTGRRYDNSVWQQPADPAEAAKIPHCGSPTCDPVTRLKTEPDWTGDPRTAICGKCHPAMRL
ncbi:hypothetical protein OID55_10985 [Streptomyces sp. NBC_00715]|uniref:hypothetical protein n=1 Tax=Streptomyces sp. NBC_00715 TaxID=2975811 RepID=UPI00386D6B17